MHDPIAISLTRRGFLKTTAATAAGLLFSSSQSWGAVDYAGLESDRYLDKLETLATIETDPVFTEGPAVNARGDLYFTNVAQNQILRFDPATKKVSIFRENSNAANGLLFDAADQLLACEGGVGTEPGRVTRTDLATGLVTVLCDEFGGRPLGAPNDLALDSMGRIYFTSRLPNADPTIGNVNAVYRIDSVEKTARILALPETGMPNGIDLSPDEKTLYVVESHPDADRTRGIRAFDLQADGTVTNGRTLVDFAPGRSGDGLCIDVEGNLYIAAGLHATRKTSETLDTKPGIHVVSPKGKLLAYLATPVDTITNCTFGGSDRKTLYITCGKFLLQARTALPGKLAPRPKA